MALRLYNTLTRRKQDFTPLDPERVRLYVCGPTVYDRAHIGNARPVIVFDVLFRLLRHLYGPDHVVYARNITDIDDKIIERAAERGVSIRELTDGTARGFAHDVAGLGCLVPSVEPRATDHVAEMIAVTERLVRAGHAYAGEGSEGAGHVLFSVGSMADYGRLSHRTLDEMIAGARIEVAPYKRADGDFVLWKPSTPDEPGWESPWGRGRPGWHLECSAMTWKHLGETFDIHGGGIDLIFPHHENELAQSCCAFDRPFMAQVWMHNGFLQVEGQKMSKSLGNFITIQDLLESDVFGGRRWPGEVLRLAMLRTHYRQPIDWTVKALEEAEHTLDRWYGLVEGVDAAAAPASSVLDELSDDLNTPAAIAALHNLFAKADRNDSAGQALGAARMLGLLGETSSGWRSRRVDGSGVDATRVERLIAARLAARRDKDWAESDRIREEAAALGVVLKDNKDGTTSWNLHRKGAP